MKVAEDRTPARSPGPRSGKSVKVPQNALLVRFFLHPVGKAFLILCGVLFLAAAGTFIYFYNQYAKLIDERLAGGAYNSTSRVFAAPTAIAVGDATTPADLAGTLRHAGYNENRNNPIGYYTLRADAIDIFPGADSYFDQEASAVKFSNGKISRIVALNDNTDRPQYELEPQLITNLHDRKREKQRVVHYEDIPANLRNAILSAEDKRFFSHSGFDPIGIARSAWIDIRRGRNEQGASTLTMQLARNMFLTLDRNWRRKAAEIMITLQLEQKLTKEQIFELYCNQIDLGYHGAFELRGFGEAAQAYFGKDLKSLTLPEAATLAGIARGASYYNPYRHPDRVKDRRNWILGMMRQNGYIDDREYGVATETPLKLQNGATETSDAPYFVDLVNEDLDKRFPGYDFQVHNDKIYTTLDLNLQRAANEAVSVGMKQVDDIARKQKRWKTAPFVEPQCALIALDPHTGEIKALIGGRNYGMSQLNRILAERPPGSIFKPFVYATALNTAVVGGTTTLTPASIVVDEATTFTVPGQPDYEPQNFEHEFEGPVTLRHAMAKSLNVATIKVAEMVGYKNVVNFAHKAGISEDVKATPAMAIGSYVATPLEMAGAYTVFANKGVRVQPTLISLIKESNGKVLLDQKPQTKPVLDPRVDYLMVSMLEEVLRSGTAAGVRGRGFTVPAAGKTGTSHDGWFAGFTSDLLCIVWVGYDDYSQLDIEGAHSALPVWTEFMKRAIQLRPYSNPREFQAPDGVVTINIDPLSGMPATAACPKQAPEVFIAGTEPVGACPLHGGKGDQTIVSGWDNATASTAGAKNATATPPPPRRTNGPTSPAPLPYQNQTDQDQKGTEKKKGIFGKIKSVFK
jgi:penicillin-binding protein 1B